MGNGFWMAVGQMLSICFWTVKYLPYGGWHRLPRRTMMFGLAIPVFLILQFIHWLGFLVDELLFRGYRRVTVERPVIISGVPRSGTTHLHRVMAQHEQLTSMQTWECIFAPSISERYLWRALGRVTRPVQRWLKARQWSTFRRFSAIHPLGLAEPEEDFLVLLPINACFLMVVLFPEEVSLWRLAHFDAEVSAKRRVNIMKFYNRMLQKHLYFHGTTYRYLCKNPTYTAWLESLKESFPDATFVLCHRPAEETLPSQLSALLPGWRLFHGPMLSNAFEQRMVSMLVSFYRNLFLFTRVNDRVQAVAMTDLTGDLAATVRIVLATAELPETEPFNQALQGEVEAARRYRSRHQYQERGFRVRWADVAHRFRDCSPESTHTTDLPV